MREFQGSFKDVLRKFQGCLKKVWRVFQENFKQSSKDVSMKFYFAILLCINHILLDQKEGLFLLVLNIGLRRQISNQITKLILSLQFFNKVIKTVRYFLNSFPYHIRIFHRKCSPFKILSSGTKFVPHIVSISSQFRSYLEGEGGQSNLYWEKEGNRIEGLEMLLYTETHKGEGE